MRSVLLDTNAYAALLRGDNPSLLDHISMADNVLMSAVVLGELYAGFRGGSRYDANVADLREFLDGPMVSVAAITDETAEVFGDVKDGLKKRGTPIPMNDVWIASQCIELGAILVTYDPHFDKVQGLRFWPKA